MSKELANKNYKKELTVLDDYMRQVKLPKKLLLGRIIPDVPAHSPIMVEWAEEQYDRVLNGILLNGKYYNPYFYHFLNFFIFEVPILKNGIPTGSLTSSYAHYSNVDEYIFDKFWEASTSGMHTSLMTGRGQGKAQKVSTLTPTPNGLVKFGNLKIGCEIYTKNGTVTNVSNIKEYGKIDTYTIKTNDGRTTNCSTGHLWDVYDIQDKKIGKEETKVIESIEIAEKLTYGKGRLRYRYALPISSEVEFPGKKQLIDPYIIGYLLGNGSFRKGHGIRVSTIYEFVVDEFKRILGCDYELTRDYTTVEYYIKNVNRKLKGEGHGLYTNPLIDKIKEIGLYGHLSRDKYIPEEYKYGSLKQRYDLVQGLMDSDGYASDTMAEYYSVSEQLIDDLAFVIRSLGIKCLKGEDIRFNELKGFRLYIYTGKEIFRLPIKKNKLKSDDIVSDRIRRFRYRTSIVDMNLTKSKENSRCIEVSDESGTYLTEDFLVTHNSFIGTSIINRRYNFFPESHCVVSASISDHVDTAWKKVQETLRLFNARYPMFAHKTLRSDEDDIMSGVRKSTDMGDIKTGFLCHIEKVLYGKNANKTRSMRPTIQLLEEFGAFPSKGPASLMKVLQQSAGSHRIGGGLVKTFMMMMGTGGSVDNDDAKEVFLNPTSYNIMPIYEWHHKGSGLFFPVNYKYSGTWEKTGTPDLEEGLRLEEVEREKLKDDPLAYQNHCQEFPLTLTEVFLKKGTNLFNQEKIALRWTALEQDRPKIKKGSLEYKQNKNGLIDGVEFKENGVGPINIVEDVEFADDGQRYNDLYVMGVDSIDQGVLDSATKGGSELVALVKKRIVNGKYFSSSSNKYVAWYAKRSNDVRDDYEEVLKLSLYYESIINLEYTKIDIYSYFRTKKMHHMFMTRPSITNAASGNKKSKLIGTTASTQVIMHQDEKIRDYVNDFCDNIDIVDMLTQLRDYQQEDRTKYDFVIAMGMCELADEDLQGKLAAPPPKSATDGLVTFGYYRDSDGNKKYGKIPLNNGDAVGMLGLTENKKQDPVRWVDTSGKPRWDNEYSKSVNELNK